MGAITTFHFGKGVTGFGFFSFYTASFISMRRNRSLKLTIQPSVLNDRHRRRIPNTNNYLILGRGKQLFKIFANASIWENIAEFSLLYILNTSITTRNYRSYRNGNFCKETQFSKIIAGKKVDARAKQQKKTDGFSHMSVMANLLCFGCFAAG